MSLHIRILNIIKYKACLGTVEYKWTWITLIWIIIKYILSLHCSIQSIVPYFTTLLECLFSKKLVLECGVQLFSNLNDILYLCIHTILEIWYDETYDNLIIISNENMSHVSYLETLDPSQDGSKQIYFIGYLIDYLGIGQFLWEQSWN